METYVVDAHSLVWFIAEDERLSKPAERLLDQAEEGEVQVLIPTVVLAEITYIYCPEEESSDHDGPGAGTN